MLPFLIPLNIANCNSIFFIRANWWLDSIGFRLEKVEPNFYDIIWHIFRSRGFCFNRRRGSTRSSSWKTSEKVLKVLWIKEIHFILLRSSTFHGDQSSRKFLLQTRAQFHQHFMCGFFASRFTLKFPPYCAEYTA